MGSLLSNKRIAVTGSSSGIGFETSRLLAAEGAEVIGIDINENLGHVDEFYCADLSDKAAIDALVDILPDRLDGLVNNAGLPPTGSAEKLIAVNLVGLKHLTTLLVPKLGDNASIVNVASLAGFGWPEAVEAIKASEFLDFDGIREFVRRWQVGSEGGRSYFFSKEALIVWTMQNRWTWRDRGIRMNSVSPGPVRTPIREDFQATLGERAVEDAQAMHRPGEPNDIAPVIALLLSDYSDWIRGTNIPADGGFSSHLLCEMNGL